MATSTSSFSQARPPLAAAAVLPTQELFTFPAGNVRIFVTYKNERIVGRVSFHALVLASPVWKKFVHPPFPKPPASNASQALNPPRVLLAAGSTTNTITTVLANSVMNHATTLVRAGNATPTVPADGNNTSLALFKAPASIKIGKELAKLGSTASDVRDEEEMKEIEFADDDGKALLLLLRIAHLQFNKIPLTLIFDQFLNVAILCDMYSKGNEKYLLISWVFHRESIFVRLAEKFVKEVRLKDEQCLTGLGVALLDLIPDGLVTIFIPFANQEKTNISTDSIMVTRQDTITKIYDLYKELIKKHSATVCKHNYEPCSAMMDGTLMRAIVKAQMWAPQEFPTTFCPLSIIDFAAPLRNLRILVPDVSGTSHFSCKPFESEIRSSVRAIINKIPSPVLESHR
ncbi:hypothetical protein B0J14DRAFT_684826 [Halenospora varia]|nr:hypothetical protein B0J14DRAFT_684826 [Halenospora varia]